MHQLVSGQAVSVFGFSLKPGSVQLIAILLHHVGQLVRQ
jgi:hypothetical protein